MMSHHIKDDLYQLGAHVQNEYGFEAVLTYVLLNDGSLIRENFAHYIPLIREGMMQAVEMPFPNF